MTSSPAGAVSGMYLATIITFLIALLLAINGIYQLTHGR